MSSRPRDRSAKTIADLLAIPADERFHELIDGEIVRKALPSGEHGDAQSALVSRIKGPFQRRPGGRLPGGWWIFTEVEVELAPSHVYRVHAEPFEALELPVGTLFGEDEDE